MVLSKYKLFIGFLWVLFEEKKLYHELPFSTNHLGKGMMIGNRYTLMHWIHTNPFSMR